MLIIGEKFGQYSVNSAIGAGGMGEIYLASDTRLKRDVALKILPENLMRDASAIERFVREAHAVSALNHPNILTIYDIGKHDDVHFIVTEFVAGQTLRQKLINSILSLPAKLDIAVQAASALIAAHEAGIVHRDIKPENVMVRADGYVKLLDFGIAKLTTGLGFGNAELGSNSAPTENPESQIANPKSNTVPGMILGTAFYMSPEQIRGLEIDSRSDIFSLGAMIYEMAAGRQPFTGASVADVLAAVLQFEPSPLSALAVDAPPELERIILRALQKNRDERYQTMKEFWDDLKRLRQRLEFETEFNRGSDSHRPLTVNAEILSAESVTQMLPSRPSSLPTRKTRVRRAIDSLAVLPLVNEGNNESNDADTDYLADGVTEYIINSLSKLPKLRVVPRSTVFRYKGRENDLLKIGEELGVRAIFSGRVRQTGNSIIVQTELVDVANQAQIWGEQYRREMTDIFTLQEEIAADISEELRLKLSGKDKKQLVRRDTENSEAYRYYLKGRYFVTSKRTEEWIKKGIEHFQKAIDLDPNYALAYAGIAEAYGFLASSTGGWRPETAYPKAKAAAEKALELDHELGEAHCSLGFFRLLYDWNFAEAEREFKQAIRFKPDYPNAHDGYGFYLKAVGRHAEAIEKCRAAQKLDLLSPFAHVSLGYAYYFARDYERAIEECRKALEMDNYSIFAYRNLGLAYLQQGNFESAIDALRQAVTFSGDGLAFESFLGFAYAAAGRRAEAVEVLETLLNLAEQRYIPAYNFAVIYLGLSENERSLEWLEKAFKERSGFLPFINVEPLLDPLRGTARFQNLVRRVGFPQRAISQNSQPEKV